MERRYFIKGVAGAIGSASLIGYNFSFAQSLPVDNSVTPLSLSLSGPGRLGFYVDYSERSDAGAHTFYVCRTHGTQGAVSVAFASSGDNHAAASGILNWSDGEADIKSFSVTVTPTNLVSQAAAGLGEHRVIATLLNPQGGAVLHHGAHTRAYGIVDSPNMIASQNNAIFVDFDSGTNGNGSLASPYNNWYSARDAWGQNKPRYIYGKGSAIPDGTDQKGGVKVFDEEGSNGNLTGTSEENRLIIRNWPGETWKVTGGGDRQTSGFYIESGCDYTTFKGIDFDGLDSTGKANAPNQCYSVWLRRSCVSLTMENCVIKNIKSGAVSGTGAIYADGGPIGMKVWRCDVSDISKANTSLPNGFEIYDGGSVSIQRSSFRGCSIYQKDSPDSGETGISVRFCIVDEMIRLSGLGSNPAGSNHIIQGNLISQTGRYTNPAIRMDGGGSNGEKHWIVGNVFNDCGGSNKSPILSENGGHKGHIIFNNIFYTGRGIWRLSAGSEGFEYSAYNHDYNVASTGGWKYHYKGSQWQTTEAMNAALGFEANMTTGDPLFVNLAAEDCHLQSASPCRHSGVSATSKGIFLAGIEVLGSSNNSFPAQTTISPPAKMPFFDVQRL